MVNQKVCKKKYLSWVYGVDRKNPSLGATDRHFSASVVMPISDPRDGFFNAHHTPMKDTLRGTAMKSISGEKFYHKKAISG